MENIKEAIENLNNKENNSLPIKYVSLREFILFKEEFLKYLGQLKKEVNENISKKHKEFDLFIEKTSNTISSYNDNNNNNFLTKLNFIEEKNEIFSYIKKIETDFNNKMMVNKINLMTCQKDLSDACFKYDKIVTDNLLVSGLIGTSCKYSNLKEYIINNKEEISINSFEIQKISLEIKEHKNRLENIYEQLKYQIMTMKNNYQAYTELKINELNEKFENFIKIIKEKVSTLNLTNNQLVENLKEQESKVLDGVNLIEKLKNEVVENNLNTANEITKNNKATINQLTKTKNEFKSMKKNILDLSLLLTKKENDKNKKVRDKIINNFNDMMNNLIKETFIKEKRSEYINYNNANHNNNKYPNLIISNKDKNNNDLNGLMKLSQSKEIFGMKRTLTQNINTDKFIEDNKRKSFKIKLNDTNSQEQKIKSKFSKLVIENNNNINNYKNDIHKDIDNINFKNTNSSSLDKNRKSFLSGDLKIDKTFDEINIQKSNHINIIGNTKNQKNNNEKDELNKNSLKNINKVIENEIEFKIDNSKVNENIFNKKINEKINIKEKKSSEIKEDKEDEQNVILVNEENISDKDDNETFTEKEKSDNKLILESNKSEKSSSIINEQPKTKINFNKIDSNSKQINKSIENINNNIKDFSKNKLLLLKQNKTLNNSSNLRLLKKNNINNIKTNNIENNTKNILLSSGIRNYNSFQVMKKNNLPVTKSIFSLYDYLRTSSNLKGNKTEVLDLSNFKKRDKINIRNSKNLEKNILNKELLEKINIIKDGEIIDKPLLYNQENFEVSKCTGDVEKKLLHLEFFMKKKFDELVREIKIFIPIHFNSYTRDYKVIEK